jgi:hypothetical protein
VGGGDGECGVFFIALIVSLAKVSAAKFLVPGLSVHWLEYDDMWREGIKFMFPMCVILTLLADPWVYRSTGDLRLTRISRPHISFGRLYPAFLASSLLLIPTICALIASRAVVAMTSTPTAGTTRIDVALFTLALLYHTLFSYLLAVLSASGLHVLKVRIVPALIVSYSAAYLMRDGLGFIFLNFDFDSLGVFLLQGIGGWQTPLVALVRASDMVFMFGAVLGMIALIRWAAFGADEDTRLWRPGRMRVLLRQVWRGRLVRPAIVAVALTLASHWIFGLGASHLLESINAGASAPTLLGSPWGVARGGCFAAVLLAWNFRRRNPTPHRHAQHREILRFIVISCGALLVGAAYMPFSNVLDSKSCEVTAYMLWLWFALAMMFPILAMIHTTSSPRPARALFGWLLAIFWYEMCKQKTWGGGMSMKDWNTAWRFEYYWMFPLMIIIALLLWGALLERSRESRTATA